MRSVITCKSYSEFPIALSRCSGRRTKWKRISCRYDWSCRLISLRVCLRGTCKIRECWKPAMWTRLYERRVQSVTIRSSAGRRDMWYPIRSRTERQSSDCAGSREVSKPETCGREIRSARAACSRVGTEPSAVAPGPTSTNRPLNEIDPALPRSVLLLFTGLHHVAAREFETVATQGT